MNTQKLLLILSFSILSLLHFSCSTPLTTEFMQNRTSIVAGDSAKIHWRFYGADYVAIAGHNEHYSPIDSAIVLPNETGHYYVIAHSIYDDILITDWLVEVSDPYDKGINRVPIAGSPVDNSNEEGDIANVNSFTITGIVADADNKYYLRFVANDVNGELVHNLNFNSDNVTLAAPHKSAINIRASNISEYKVSDAVKYNFCFCIDNSAAAEYNSTIVKSIALLPNIQPESNNLYISYFNQNYGGVEKVDGNIANKIPLQSGFCASNKSVGQAINYLVNTEGRNVIVLITSSADNASVLYDERDLIEHSNRYNIPIYVIAIGSSTYTYNLEYLANATGGRLFLLNDYEVNTTADYLKLIIASQRHFYNAEIVAEVPYIERKMVVEMDMLIGENDVLTDGIYYPLLPEKIFAEYEYQILASYPLGDTLLSEHYFPQIANLADVMKANPELIVELIGNASAKEGNDETCKKIALRRAQIVRRKLIEYGVHPEQMRLYSEGAESPWYQIPSKDWQVDYNNRVGIRWLLPEEYPYEIIAEYSTSENDAIEIVEKWEKKGYQSYYQRVMKNDRPAYRVLIWGYQTEEEADNYAQKLSKEYKRLFVVK
ncbi:MAG: OmpA family protein [Ignavibacteria bacterium]|jgi:hypothetical protein|nr:OmpA family protein [Ignavibacteria bacterium]